MLRSEAVKLVRQPPGIHMPRILFAVHTSTAFVEPFRLAKLLAAEDMEPIFIFAFHHWTAENFAQQCDNARISVFKLPELKGTWNRLLARTMWLSVRAQRRWRWWGVHFVSEFLQLHQSTLRVNAAFDTLRPDLLVMSIDLAGYDTGAYVKVAHQRGCKVLLVSSMMSIGLDQAEVYYNNRDYHVRGRTRRWLARAFPHWVFRHRGLDILRCPPGRVLAMEVLRLAPPNPWLFNSSWAEAFNMESDAMLEYYAAAGTGSDGRAPERIVPLARPPGGSSLDSYSAAAGFSRSAWRAPGMRLSRIRKIGRFLVEHMLQHSGPQCDGCPASFGSAGRRCNVRAP